MNILLLGRNGQVGWELQRSLALLGNVVSLERNAALNQDALCGDLADMQGLRETVRQLKPDVIVNAAAYTAVDKAETESEAAFAINAKAPEMLAQEAKALGAWLVHYSTDYVFDGSGNHAWSEVDGTAPLSIYGQSKLDGERAIIASGCNHLIFRTSWVYGAYGNNFLKTMLRLGTQRDELSVVADQFGAPTGAELLADATAHALRQLSLFAAEDVGGIYHLSASGETNWCDYARWVLQEAQRLNADLKIAQFKPIGTADYPTPARRPLNSRLDTSRLRQTFGVNLPDWREGVSRVVQELHRCA